LDIGALVKVPNEQELEMGEFSTEDNIFNLWRFFRQTGVIMGRARQKELKQYGISIEQAGAIDCVHVSGNSVTPTEISKWLILRPQSVSGLLNRMEEKGLITKTKDTERRNVVRVSLTEKGEQAYNELAKRKSIYSIIMSIDEEEREQLASILIKIQKASRNQLGTDKI